MTLRRVLHISFDGLSNAIGYSQVARVAAKIATHGIEQKIVSLEPPRRHQELERARGLLARAGVRWMPLPYAAGPASSAHNLISVFASTLDFYRRDTLVVARGYQAALAAVAVREMIGVPFVFDARGYWVDEQIEGGRRFLSAAPLAAARRIERRLYQSAAAIVTLTELHAADLLEGKFGRIEGPVVTIPTCADYAEFVPREHARNPPPRELLGTAGPVIGIIGSVNASYRCTEMVALAAQVLRVRPDANLIVLTEQREAFQQMCVSAGIGRDRFLVRTVPHSEVPDWLPWIDWGVLFLVESDAKRASMPTKLAEFFAAGVRPVFSGCNAEVRNWVLKAGTGLVVDSVDASSIERAAVQISAASTDRRAIASGRTATQEHFDLDQGSRRYFDLFRRLGVEARP